MPPPEPIESELNITPHSTNSDPNILLKVEAEADACHIVK